MNAPDYVALLQKYCEQEEDNQHTANTVLLTEVFGTLAEQEMAKRFKAQADIGQGASADNCQFTLEISRKYCRRLVELAVDKHA